MSYSRRLINNCMSHHSSATKTRLFSLLNILDLCLLGSLAWVHIPRWTGNNKELERNQHHSLFRRGQNMHTAWSLHCQTNCIEAFTCYIFFLLKNIFHGGEGRYIDTLAVCGWSGGSRLRWIVLTISQKRLSCFFNGTLSMCHYPTMLMVKLLPNNSAHFKYF